MAEMAMLERMARSIYAKVYGWPYTDLDDLGPWLAVARATLEEMRHPTQVMQSAGDNALDRAMQHDEVDGVTISRNAFDAEILCWAAMINAALSEQP